MATEKAKQIVKAVAYMRTSSAANVGEDKDSERRQRAAIDGFAKRSGFAIVDAFYDPAVSGADPIETRGGFAAMLDRIEGNGVRVVIVEEVSRFARTVLAQELGVLAMQKRGVRVLTSNGDDLTASDDPMRVFQRQVAGAFCEFEKNRLVSKLAAARNRRRLETGKCEGRKPLRETAPEAVAMAKQIRASVRKHKPSLRAIAAKLAEAGHVNVNGNPYNAKSIAAMLAA